MISYNKFSFVHGLLSLTCTVLRLCLMECHECQLCFRQDTCSYEVLVYPDGMVSSNWTSKSRQNKFSVIWKDERFPSSQSCPGGCQVFGDVCSCGMTEEIRPVFSQMPTVSDLTKLKIGATPPSSACSECDGNIRVYNQGQTIDEHTVFEHQGKFYSNKESVVLVSGGFEFRNPPVFLPTVYAETRRCGAWYCVTFA